ncbi:MAG: hypothetical protein HQL22_09970 [Candidatus Omnitrophica bacterium]|nr:hypothetical protein [Candidatus Omnitrophota bacterium]
MQRHFHSPLKRGLFSLVLVVLVMLTGTIGMHKIEKLPYIDAFYFISMIATAQGPTFTPVTAAGKIFAALMAFVAVGVVVTSVGFLFGPFLGQLWHIGAERAKKSDALQADQDRLRDTL